MKKTKGKSTWGALFSEAVAGLESKIDSILADESGDSGTNNSLGSTGGSVASASAGTATTTATTVSATAATAHFDTTEQLHSEIARLAEKIAHLEENVLVLTQTGSGDVPANGPATDHVKRLMEEGVKLSKLEMKHLAIIRRLRDEVERTRRDRAAAVSRLERENANLRRSVEAGVSSSGSSGTNSNTSDQDLQIARQRIDDLTRTLSERDERITGLSRSLETAMLDVTRLESEREILRARSEDDSRVSARVDLAQHVRQVDRWQNEHAVALANWQSIEEALHARASAAEAERDESRQRESDLRRRLREACKRQRTLEDELDALAAAATVDQFNSLNDAREVAHAATQTDVICANLTDATTQTELYNYVETPPVLETSESWKHQVDELRAKLDTTLELLGEKSERVVELSHDVQDLRAICRDLAEQAGQVKE